MRSNLFFKVELDYQSEEELKAITTQIIRQLQKVYSVRSAELSSAAPDE